MLLLQVDELTLRERISTRTDNDFGQSPEEMHHILERHRELLAACRSNAVVAIDATRPLAEVVTSIIEATTVD